MGEDTAGILYDLIREAGRMNGLDSGREVKSQDAMGPAREVNTKTRLVPAGSSVQ